MNIKMKRSVVFSNTTTPLVKRGELSPPGREYKFRIGSVTREREELEGKFPTQLINRDWDNRDLENKG